MSKNNKKAQVIIEEVNQKIADKKAKAAKASPVIKSTSSNRAKASVTKLPEGVKTMTAAYRALERDKKARALAKEKAAKAAVRAAAAVKKAEELAAKAAEKEAAAAEKEANRAAKATGLLAILEAKIEKQEAQLEKNKAKRSELLMLIESQKQEAEEAAKTEAGVEAPAEA